MSTDVSRRHTLECDIFKFDGWLTWIFILSKFWHEQKHSSPFRKILTPIKENTIPYLLGEGIYFFENIHKQIMHMAHFCSKGKSVRNVATVSYISHSRGLETLRIYFYCFNVMTCDWNSLKSTTKQKQLTFYA